VEKIKQTVEALFSDLGKNIDDTKEVRLYGNMSSATVLYVLERLDNRLKEKRLNVKFWPGFSAQRVLLQFNK
jgi:predicted naringenin-chalcone synthase